MRRRLLGWLGRLGLVLAGLALALAAVEVALRLVGLGRPIMYDNRASYGYRPVPDQTRRRLFGARVHVNHLGMRGPDAPPDALRLLFLGDSVTWGGTYVDDEQTFAAVAAETVARRLSSRFPRVVAFNAGVNAWSPQNILGLVEERGDAESPLWVLTLLEDDFRREKTRIGEVPYFNVAPRTALEELLVLAGYRLLTAYKREKPLEDVDRIRAENLAACTRLFMAARTAGARLLVVWHPSTDGLAGGPEPTKAGLLAAASAASVPVLDLTDVYRGRAGVYADGLHLSVAGHRVAGTAIGERVAGMLAGG